MSNKTQSLLPPHGRKGILKPLFVTDSTEREEKIKQAKELKRIPLTSREASDMIMLGTGSFTPLNGFMVREDYQRVLKEMRLADGTLWPIPVTLAVNRDTADLIRIGEKAALYNPERKEIAGSITVTDKWQYDRKEEAGAVFGTSEEAHPGVEKLYCQEDFYIGGPVEVYSEGGFPKLYPEYSRPAETREIFRKMGWSTVAAFQTRNPIHRSHEYLTKVAMEFYDGVFIHPIVGKLKDGDIPADVRMKCYNAVLDKYYPKDRVVLKVYPMEMRYAGPREALLHGIIRQNFGCSHMIVGRDHAGVGNYYGPFEAQTIFDELEEGDLLLKPIKMDWSFWCKKCGAVVSAKTCPHGNDDHLMISGTKLREMLAKNERPPLEIGRPEVMDILIEYYSKTGVEERK